MKIAFIDDSGSGGDSAYFVLAGYVGESSMWNAFARDWKSVLNDAPALTYFKMKEAEHRNGQFEGFTPMERNVRLGRFIEVILAHEVHEASIVISAKDYHEAIHPTMLPVHRSPYYLAFIAMVTAMSGIYRWQNDHEPVDFIFDEQKVMDKRAYRLYEHFRGIKPHWNLGRVAFANDAVMVPLQAADLIAWQIRRFMCSTEGTRAELRRLHSVRPPFRSRLKRRLLIDIARSVQEDIPSIIEVFGTPKVQTELRRLARQNEREGIDTPGLIAPHL